MKNCTERRGGKLFAFRLLSPFNRKGASQYMRGHHCSLIQISRAFCRFVCLTHHDPIRSRGNFPPVVDDWNENKLIGEGRRREKSSTLLSISPIRNEYHPQPFMFIWSYLQKGNNVIDKQKANRISCTFERRGEPKIR